MTSLVAVPAFNEEDCLPEIIPRLFAAISKDDILFINDGSSDRTVQILEDFGASFVSHPVNLGYREAMITAMRWVLARDYDHVVFFDADGQHRLEDLQAIIAEAAGGEWDLLIGSRYKGGRGRKWGGRSIGTKVFSILATVFSGVKITDATCGLKSFSRRVLPTVLSMPMEDMHSELIVNLARAGARIKEVAVVIHPRRAGTSMYHFTKAILYPARTVLCLLAGVLARRRSTPLPVVPARTLGNEVTE